MWPLIVLTDDQHLYTLPVALASLSRRARADNELMMAGIGGDDRCPCWRCSSRFSATTCRA